MKPERKEVRIVKQELLAADIYSMVLDAPEIAREAKAGQFVSLYCRDGSRLLPRPISICEKNDGEGTLRLVYRTVGDGTKEFSSYAAGETVALMGPLGNGFEKRKERAVLVGGGIGIPPMLQLAKELTCEKTIVLGYRDEVFLADEFEPYGEVILASEDGTHGVKGNVLDAIRHYGVEGAVIYACGPLPMLRGIKEYATAKHLICQLSLEERMACGIGACLACVCRSNAVDPHTNVKKKRICKEGPVFYAEEVDLS